MQGDARAQLNLGVMYENGRGVAEDHAEAAKWFRLAAEQGDAAAQYNLGVMYANGEGVPQSKYTAADFFYQAGLSFLGEGNRENALNALSAIDKIAPDSPLKQQLTRKIYPE